MKLSNNDKNMVSLIFPKQESEENDVVILFNDSRTSGIDLSQQLQINKCLNLINNNTQQINNLSLRLNDVVVRLNEKIITGTNLTESQNVGDYYILQTGE